MSTTVAKKGSVPAGADTVYIGRPSRWGNPYVIGRDGDRGEVIAKYRKYVLGALHEEHLSIQSLRRDLRGKTLVCHCAPEPCHGDVLAEIVDASPDEYAALMIGWEVENPRMTPP